MLKNLIERADELYRHRGVVGPVKESLGLLNEASSNPPAFEIEWRLSRACFFLGQESESVTAAKTHHLNGIDAGARAVSGSDERVEGHFWLGVNLGLAAALSRSVTALRLVLRARAELKKAVAIDETYHGAGPLRVLARLGHQAPSWLAGGKRESRANYERAIAIAPANTVTRVYFAELLLDLGDATRAREQLELLLALPLDPEWAFEGERDKQLAEGMLNEIEKN